MTFPSKTSIDLVHPSPCIFIPFRRPFSTTLPDCSGKPPTMRNRNFIPRETPRSFLVFFLAQLPPPSLSVLHRGPAPWLRSCMRVQERTRRGMHDEKRERERETGRGDIEINCAKISLPFRDERVDEIIARQVERNLSFLFSDRIDRTHPWIDSRFIELNYLTSAASCTRNIPSPLFLHESLNINRFVFLSVHILLRLRSELNFNCSLLKDLIPILNLEFLIMTREKCEFAKRGEYSLLVKVFQVTKDLE